MKISLDWLKTFISFDLDPETVAAYLTDCGLEVESMHTFQSVPGGLEGLITGHVVEKSKHPNADKLSLTKVDAGGSELLQIVCGAPNVAAGQKVIVAPVNCTIHPVTGEPFTIKKSKIRGEVSEGMLCAADEVGLGEDHSGILVLPEDTAVGVKVKDLFDVTSDVVFEIGLTPNRGDAASHLGVARDLLAALKHKGVPVEWIHKPASIPEKERGSKHITVELKRPDACPRYSGVTIENIRIAPSPAWLQNRLKAIGLKPISNVVDITNYVLHELGQPLHAFDADQIRGEKVVVDCLPEGTPFVTLDDKERKLRADDLMICDAEGGMCIGGVFGGIVSGVSDTTRSVFLESACFHPGFIRRTSSHHDLKTDASFRFERGTDPENTLQALRRAASLICELAGGTITSDTVDLYPERIAPRQINIRYARVHRLLGKQIPPEEIRQILEALQFEWLEDRLDGALIAAPTFKVEVTREADVIEEVLRIYGCNSIEASTHTQIGYVHENRRTPDRIRNAMADLLVANGFSEIMCNSLTSEKHLTLFPPPDQMEPARIINPLSSDLSVMRTSMLIGGLETLVYNINRKNLQLNLFEFGRTYARTKDTVDADAYREQSWLALYTSGNRPLHRWSGKEEEAGLIFLKSCVDQIFRKAGLAGVTGTEAASVGFSACLSYADQKGELAVVGEIAPAVRKHMDLNQPAFGALIHWEGLLDRMRALGPITYKEVGKFPAVRRDLALLLNKSASYASLEAIAWKYGSKLLREVRLFDVFEGEKIGKDKKSYAISFTFRDDEKTLTDGWVDQTMKKLADGFRKEASAEVRES
ncbi:MAG: phenylalanine--tRNA ligase subunit beta [Flavobacteriales bacterium]|nr:phenylalanine--tRNA ligase subunit beta [Flavobacteriales bacterium]